MRRSVFLFIFPAVLLQFNFVFSQMPDWKYYRDREGNSYYFDRAFHIRIAEQKIFDCEPVSEQGAQYYFNRGVEYIDDHQIVRGLYYLKSLMCIYSENNRFRKIKRDASLWINHLKKRHGTRYEKYDAETSLLHVKKNKSFVLINEKMYYSLSCSRKPVVISRGWKRSGKEFSLRIAFRSGDPEKSEGYDYVAAVESRDYGFTLKDVGVAQSSWVREYGTEKVIRNEISSEKNFKLYKFSYPDGSPFTGYEAFFISGNKFHFMKIMCHESLGSKLLADMEKLARGFKTVTP